MPIDNKSIKNHAYLATSKVLPLSFVNLIYSTDFGEISRKEIERELIEVDKDK